jgi:hypothetical protein
VGAGGQVAGAGLFGPMDAALLAGLDAGLDGPSGDGGGPVLGRLGVLVPGGAGDSGAEELHLFAAAGPTPLFGLRGPCGRRTRAWSAGIWRTRQDDPGPLLGGCGLEGRGFESPRSPFSTSSSLDVDRVGQTRQPVDLRR